MDKIQINLLLSHLHNNTWAMRETSLSAIHNFLLCNSTSISLDPKAAHGDAALEANGIVAKDRPSAKAPGAIAVIPVNGAIQLKFDIFMAFFGGTSTEQLGSQIESLASNPDVKSIVLDINSPGGTVSGLIELADIITKAKEKVHVVAVCNTLCASAAYWIAAQCDEIVSTPSGDIGSIGVYRVHEDWSAAFEAAGVKPTIIKYGANKTEGNYMSLYPRKLWMRGKLKLIR